VGKGAVLVAAALFLAACGTNGGEAAPTTVAITSPTTDGGSASTSTSGPEAGAEASTPLDRDGLRKAVESSMADTSLDPTDAQIDCYTRSLIDEVGLERLDEVGVPRVDLLSGVVLARMTTNIDDAAAYFTPFFTCLDGERFVRESVSDLPRPIQDCIVDAVLADREVRVIYVLGTKKGSGPNRKMERMTAPLVERSFEIEQGCIAQG
jgi:hypothetical protein